MAELPTPPASRQSSESPELHLKQSNETESSTKTLQLLDHSLERYLLLLDQHQKLQTNLAKELSSVYLAIRPVQSFPSGAKKLTIRQGFFSLAHANYTCPPGRRYGADYYDERMKAIRRMAIRFPPCAEKEKIMNGAEDAPQGECPPDEYRQIFAIDKTTNNQRVEEPETSKGKEEADSGIDNTRQVDPSAAPDPDSSKERSRFSDPIHWYGILVSPSLRSAQRSFREAVEQYLPKLASVVVEMQTVEREVERLRSQLR
ncbi:coiled-coil domain-containing protein 115 [Aspergillus udagawae]|uniref:Vacuolar ATPase assembly protein VMA22 n=1 Tax=Aspergillus udagawae TaxID=91492 RepID=A0A8H3N5N0_9EURO|nr:coiled-coil domain-containing protein 115 [Aspergillus udagawae]